jgi:hypothetical protein
MAESSSGGGGSGGGTHANRDRSDMAGSPDRPAEQTGERGSGRSASNESASGRNTHEKEKEA